MNLAPNDFYQAINTGGILAVLVLIVFAFFRGAVISRALHEEIVSRLTQEVSDWKEIAMEQTNAASRTLDQIDRRRRAVR